MAKVLDGTSDWVMVVDPETGHHIHCHTDCMPGGDDLSVVAVELPVEGPVPVGALVILYQDELTARLRFAGLRKAAEASTLRVSFISRNAGREYALLINAGDGNQIRVPTIDQQSVGVVSRALKANGAFLLLSGRSVANGLQPFDDCMIECQECLLDQTSLKSADMNRATALDTANQTEFAAWQALPFWRRLRTKKPKLPGGI